MERLEVSDGTAHLTAPDRGGLLTLTCFWHDGPEAEALEKVLDLDRHFPPAEEMFKS